MIFVIVAVSVVLACIVTAYICTAVWAVYTMFRPAFAENEGITERLIPRRSEK